ncbi:NRDE family protein [Haloparvum sedimenti]|uniref:NRDE family protein n=1 Tax=Haloparvum sedimenti TaxID=1678448 RepID=UPI00071E773B|nr:NRDE family protein [Haloparvum sedimenti]
MCTLALAWRVFEGTPVAAAANRDEGLGRPSEPPSLWGVDEDAGASGPADPNGAATDAAATDDGIATFLAPRDAEAGGTWVGLNEYGCYATVTNRWLDEAPPAERSRGLLVRDCLRAPTAEAAVRRVEREVRERSYDGFNLAIADARAAFVVSWDGRLSIERLDPGVHVLTNVGGLLNGRGRFAVPERRREAGDEQIERVGRLADRLGAEPGDGADAWLDRAGTAMADHEVGVCVHGDGYGTRSSTLVGTGSAPRFAFADGPPCETEYVDVPLPDDWPRAAPEGDGHPEGQV